MDVLALSAVLHNHPELREVFDYNTITKYFDLINLLRPSLSAVQASYRPGPPATLPVNIHEFLKQSLGISDHAGKIAWEGFRELVWSLPLASKEQELASRIKYLELFLKHGVPRKIGAFMFILGIFLRLTSILNHRSIQLGTSDTCMPRSDVRPTTTVRHQHTSRPRARRAANFPHNIIHEGVWCGPGIRDISILSKYVSPLHFCKVSHISL